MLARGSANINLIFYPQPLLYQLRKDDRQWIKPTTYLLECCSIDSLKHEVPDIPQDKNGKIPYMPHNIVRKPDSDRGQLNAMLYSLAGFIYVGINLCPSMTSSQVRDDVAVFIDKMDGNSGGPWTTTSTNSHTHKMVTMIVPMNDILKRAVVLSFDF
jgi:hypothetical protein